MFAEQIEALITIGAARSRGQLESPRTGRCDRLSYARPTVINGFRRPFVHRAVAVDVDICIVALHSDVHHRESWASSALRVGSRREMRCNRQYELEVLEPVIREVNQSEFHRCLSVRSDQSSWSCNSRALAA